MKVSDHALIRWMERMMQIDVEKHRDHILDVCGPALKVGASSYRDALGFTYVIRNGVVVTILDPDQKFTSRAHNPIQEMFDEEMHQ